MSYDDNNSFSHCGHQYDIIDLGAHALLPVWGHSSHYGQLSHSDFNNKSSYCLIKQFSNDFFGLEM